MKFFKPVVGELWIVPYDHSVCFWDNSLLGDIVYAKKGDIFLVVELGEHFSTILFQEKLYELSLESYNDIFVKKIK